MKTKLTLTISLCLFVLLSGCIPGVTIQGDGNLITENINISDYKEIKVSGAEIVFNYKQSTEKPELTIVTDKNIFDLYDFESTSGILTIKPKAKERWTNFRPTEFTVTTNSSAVDKISASGKITINVNSSLTAEELNLDLSGSSYANFPEEARIKKFKANTAGSGTINAANLYSEEFRGDIAGSGTLILAGETEKINLSIAGSGTVKAFDLQVKELRTSIAGSGDIQMTVTEKINADIAGSGKIRYKGNPGTIEKSIAGSGSIKPAE